MLLFVKLGVPAGFDLEKAALDGANLMKTRLIWDKSVNDKQSFHYPKNPEAKSRARIYGSSFYHRYSESNS